jgi:hypothetical protein
MASFTPSPKSHDQPVALRLFSAVLFVTFTVKVTGTPIEPAVGN